MQNTGKLMVVIYVLACISGAHTTFTIGDHEFSHVWNSKKPMPTKRSDLTATTVGDAIYLIGGCDSAQEWSSGANMYLCTGLSKKVEKYLPKSNAYETMTDAPRSRYRHAAAAVGSKIYLLGGCGIDDSIIFEVDVLDTLTGEWSTLNSLMPNATSDLSAFVHNGKIYTLGGYDRPNYIASSSMMIFSPAESGANAWSKAASLKQGRGDAAAAFVGGQAFALGGFHHGNWSYPMDHLEMYDAANPGAGWRVRDVMKVARGDKAVAVLHDHLHVVGGETKNQAGHSVPLMDVEVYDSAKDRWHAGGSIPSHRFRFVAASHGDSLFVFGGQGALIGSHGASGSKYPVIDVVDEYLEKRQQAASISAADSLKHATYLAMLFELFLSFC